MRIAFVLSAALITSQAMGAEPTEQEINAKIVELMQSTEVSMRDGLDVPSAEYKSDGNPNTLELVLSEAFTIRARLQLAK